MRAPDVFLYRGFITKKKKVGTLNSSVLNAANIPLSALAEALAVRALVYGRVVFVGAYRDTVQGAVVCAAGVVFALLHRAADRHICMSIRHDFFLLGLVYIQYVPAAA